MVKKPITNNSYLELMYSNGSNNVQINIFMILLKTLNKLFL